MDENGLDENWAHGISYLVLDEVIVSPAEQSHVLLQRQRNVDRRTEFGGSDGGGRVHQVAGLHLALKANQIYELP